MVPIGTLLTSSFFLSSIHKTCLAFELVLARTKKKHINNYSDKCCYVIGWSSNFYIIANLIRECEHIFYEENKENCLKMNVKEFKVEKNEYFRRWRHR